MTFQSQDEYIKEKLDSISGIAVLLKDCEFKYASSGDNKIGILGEGTRIKGIRLLEYNSETHAMCLEVFPYNDTGVCIINLFEREIDEYFAKDVILDALAKEYGDLWVQYSNRRQFSLTDWLVIGIGICSLFFLGVVLLLFADSDGQLIRKAVVISGSLIFLMVTIFIVGDLFSSKHQRMLDDKESEVEMRALSLSIDDVERLDA